MKKESGRVCFGHVVWTLAAQPAKNGYLDRPTGLGTEKLFLVTSTLRPGKNHGAVAFGKNSVWDMR